MRHYELQTTSPFYVENQADRLDLTADLVNTNSNPQEMYYIADFAINVGAAALILNAVLTSRRARHAIPEGDGA